MTMVDECGFRDVADERSARYALARLLLEHRRQRMKLHDVVRSSVTKIVELTTIFVVTNKGTY